MKLSSILKQVILVRTPNHFYISNMYLEPSIFCDLDVNYNNHAIKERGGDDNDNNGDYILEFLVCS